MNNYNSVWNTSKLEDIVDVLIGGTPSRSKSEYWDKDKISNNVWVSIRDLSQLHGHYIDDSKEFITDLGVNRSNVKRLPPETVLMSFKLSIGKTAITKRHLYTNEAIAGFVIKNSSVIDKEYLFHILPRLNYDKDVAIKGNTLNKEKLKTTSISFPTISTQKKIAAILTAIDLEILKTDLIVNKTKELRRGLMDDLLWRGIQHDNFKKTKLGYIPNTWEIRLLDEVARRGSGHTPNKKFPNYWNGGIKWISLSDTSRLDHVYISNTSKQISSEGIDNSSAVLHPEGVVVLSRDAGVGKSAITTEPMAVSQHFMVWKCGNKLHNLFLYYFLQQRKPIFEKIATGSTIKTIGLPFFKKLEIPVPPINEQIKIAEILYSIDEKLENEQVYREQLLNLKNGLMDDIFNQKIEL